MAEDAVKSDRCRSSGMTKIEVRFWGLFRRSNYHMDVTLPCLAVQCQDEVIGELK